MKKLLPGITKGLISSNSLKTYLLFASFFPTILFADFKVMGLYETDSVYRGAMYWPNNILKIYPMLNIKKFHLRGPDVFFRFLPSKKPELTLDVGGRYFSDDLGLALYKKDHSNSYMNERNTSIEGFVKLKYRFGYKNLFSTQIKLGRDIIDYNGLYSEFGLGAPIFPYTKLKGKISYAEKSTHTFLYGASAESGLGFASLEMVSYFTKLIKKVAIVVSLKQYWILEKNNRYANYIRGEHRPFVGIVRIIVPLNFKI